MNVSFKILNLKIDIKNKFPENFAIYQLFAPYLYYQKLKDENQIDISEITCCYLLRNKDEKGTTIRVYNYTFEDNKSINSIKLLKAKQYNLIHR